MHNRHIIDESDLVHFDQLLNRGIPLPLLGGKYEVKEGFRAVILVGGNYEETLNPGFYHLSKYQMFRDIRAIVVDLRTKQLNITTSREFQIDKPVPVQLNLDLTLEYKVSDPRKVALEIDLPLHALFDRVIEAARPIVSNSNIDEIRRMGEGIAQKTLLRLKSMQLNKTIGIEVLNVLVTSITALDAGDDVLSQQGLDEYRRVRDWQVDTEMLRQSQMSPEWLIANRPEIYQQLIAGRTEIIRDLIDKGLIIDPASVLNSPLNTEHNSPSSLIDSLIPGISTNNSQITDPNRKLLENIANTTTDIHSRMKEEYIYLEKLPNTNVKMEPVLDNNGIPEGTYKLLIETSSSSGKNVVCYIFCDSDYPAIPPSVDIEVDGEDTPFESSILRHWKRNYLVEIVREAASFVG